VEWVGLALIGVGGAVVGIVLFVAGIVAWAAILEARSPIDPDGER